MDYHCIVIGGGHAGIEASLAVARLGYSCLLITQNPDTIGALSCNPAIGGLSKGNLVREVDALGGQMGRLIDISMIQYRVLNRSRGPAVQAPRAQADKGAYQRAARQALEAQTGLGILMDTVVDLILEEGIQPQKTSLTSYTYSSGQRVAGVLTRRGQKIYAPTVILAAGTFLEGKIFIGTYDAPQGRLGEEASLGLGQALRQRGLPMGRLKTGTPARLAGDTVDYGAAEEQESEELLPFSYDSDREGGDTPFRPLGRHSCWITYTTSETHRIIRDNIAHSPLYGGKIEGTGARYCPSIEDKVMRFPDRDRHQVFIEPEGLGTKEVYLNGLSSSLPEEVQGEFIRSVPGLQGARMVRPGYAVDYDYLDPLDLYPSLESKRIQGFFSAGQTNGSSGYEEAAAQGLLAGINAVQSLRGEAPLILGRAEAYAGVLVDDLTTVGTKEPYRMFTSRAEHRLLLRHDNADTRLSPKARELGLLGQERWDRFQKKTAGLEAIQELLIQRKAQGVYDTDEVLALVPELREHPAQWVERVCLDNKYGPYIEKEKRMSARFAKMEGIKLSADLDYSTIRGLSSEAQEKLSRVKPLTVGQAARIPGVRQGDVALLMILSRK